MSYIPEIYLYYAYLACTPRETHSVSVIKTSQIILYREIITVCSQIHTKHINTLCGQNVELLNVKLAVNIVTTGLKGLNIQSVTGSKHTQNRL